MKKIIFCILFFCIYSANVFAEKDWDTFNLEFGNKKIFQVDKYKGKYSFVCTSYIGSAEKNEPANVYYDMKKKTISYFYMERNLYPISKLEKDGNSYFIYLDNNQLIYKVKKIKDNFFIWQLVGENKKNETGIYFYTASVVKNISELTKYKIKNGCN